MFLVYLLYGNTTLSSLNVSGFSILNSTSINGALNVSSNTILNSTSINSALNVSGASTFNSITLNKNHVDPSGDALNFYYNTPGIYIHIFLIMVIHHILV